ncbi:MAG: hypothetical protein GWO75_03080 [Bacteroidetes bacterium]|nr:hypothetical protein [Bacteroidota bacterium]
MPTRMLGVICAMQWMVFFVLGLFSGHVMLAQSTDSIHAIWWNLENAFDTIDQPNVADEAFTPQGVRQWGSQRYHVKLQRLAQGLMAVSQGRPPEIMAFAEVENAEVMVDLLRKLPLSWSHWILHQDSPDARGIDVAVMYDPQRIKVLQVAWLQPKGSPSRDAVQVTFYCRKGGDSLTLLFVHLPSQRDPRPHRRLHAMQSILSQCEQVDCLVGDMNEHPKGPMGQWLQGEGMHVRDAKGPPGTYIYRNRWSWLDHVWLVDQSLWQANVRHVPFGLKKTNQRMIIHRSFQGSRYLAGSSDHLPVSIWLKPL